MKRKMNTFIFTFLLSLIICSICSPSVSAWVDVSNGTNSKDKISYYIYDVKRSGNNINIDGYAYFYRFQNYTSTNHEYSLKLVGSDNSVIYVNASKKQTAVDLSEIVKVTGVSNCPAYKDVKPSNVNCSRIINYAGFTANIPMSSLKKDVNYEVWIRIKETTGGTREYEAKLITPNITLDEFEYNHNLFSIDSDLNTNSMIPGSEDVLIRKGASKTSNKYQNTEHPFTALSSATTHATYWKMGLTYTHIKELKDTGTGGVWIRAGFGGSTNLTTITGYSPVKKVQYATNENKADGWININLAALKGQVMTIKNASKTYIDNIKLETKTAKEGDTATIKATINNKLASGQNPVKVQFYLANTEVYNSGTVNWTGNKTFTKDVPATDANRVFKVVITETTNDRVTEMQTTLYKASNQVNTINEVSGTIKGNNPIYVVKTASAETKYYETITYNQESTYYALDNSNTLSRNITLSYSTDYSSITSWNQNNISATNYISSPSSTYNLTKSNATGTSVKLSADKVVTYTNLNEKTMTSTVSGVGANNITIKLNAKYQFIDASDITKIDTRTHPKNTASEAYITINNQKNRTVHYKIYYRSTLIVDKTETWNGNKTITINSVVSEPEYIKVVIIQPNTITEELKGEIQVSTSTTVDIKKDGTYTNPTPIRIVTTPTNVQKYYETVTITSANKNPTVKAGEGFENDIIINYSTTGDDGTSINCSDISSNSSFNEKDETLDYEQQPDGSYLVNQNRTCSNSTSVKVTLPKVILNKKTGEIYKSGSVPSGVTTVDGGNKWYTALDSPNGNYNFSTTINNVGVNKMTFVVENTYNVNGSVIGNEDSKYKVIRVTNPSNPSFTWHKTYSMKDLLTAFNN